MPNDERMFDVRLLALPGVDRPEHALRQCLKRFLRSAGMRCVAVSPVKTEVEPPAKEGGK